MTFYYILPLIVLILSITNVNNRKIAVFLFFILLFFSMFRGDKVGTDTISYLNAASSSYQAFEYINTTDLKKLEILYNILTFIIYYNNWNPHCLIYAFSIITITFLYVSAKRFKVSYTLVALFYILFGYYYLSFNIARQLAAMSVMLYGVSFLTEESNKKNLFFIWVLIAAALHNSMLVALPLYFIRNIHLNRKTALIFVGGVYVIFLLFPMTLMFLGIFNNLNISFVESYGTSGDFAFEQKSMIGIVFNIFNGILMLLIFMNNGNNHKTNFMDNCFLLSLLVYALLYHGNLGTNRLTLIFTVFQCIYLSSFFMRGIQRYSVLFAAVILINYYFISGYIDGAYYLQLW